MAGQPKVVISLQNGQLGGSRQTIDGIRGFVTTGSNVAGLVAQDTVYTFFKLQDAVDIGIDANQNPLAYKTISEFYESVGDGSECWFMIVADTVPMQDIIDVDHQYARRMVVAANGRISLLGITTAVADTPTIVDGLDEEVGLAMPKMQQFVEWCDETFRPLRVLIDGKSWNGATADLYDWNQADYNGGAILLCGTDDSGNASIGHLSGHMAAHGLQENPGYVGLGALVGVTDAFYTDGETVESHEAEWDTIHDKRYISMKNHTGRTGYYYDNDQAATSAADDYSKLVRGMIIDKVKRIAYDVMINHLNQGIPVLPNGNISPEISKAWETEVENAVDTQMTAFGMISSVTAYMDIDQNVVQTGRLELSIKIQPVGYAQEIIIPLGYTLTTNA